MTQRFLPDIRRVTPVVPTGLRYISEIKVRSIVRFVSAHRYLIVLTAVEKNEKASSEDGLQWRPMSRIFVVTRQLDLNFKKKPPESIFDIVLTRPNFLSRTSMTPNGIMSNDRCASGRPNRKAASSGSSGRRRLRNHWKHGTPTFSASTTTTSSRPRTPAGIAGLRTRGLKI
jgi:hypothetical protein